MAARSWHHLMPPPAQWGGYCLYAIDLCMLSPFRFEYWIKYNTHHLVQQRRMPRWLRLRLVLSSSLSVGW